MKKLTFFLALIAMGLLTSCDPGVHYTLIVENGSSHEILLKPGTDGGAFYLENEGLLDSISLAAGSESAIFDLQEIGRVREYADCPNLQDSINVIIDGSDSLQLNFDINDPATRAFRIISEHRSGGGECECRVKILDSHIE